MVDVPSLGNENVFLALLGANGFQGYRIVVQQATILLSLNEAAKVDPPRNGGFKRSTM
jgi:hypothetical protein